MQWLREHGVTQTIWEYRELPDRVLERARFLMRGEADRRAWERAHASD